jgi:hypothetical protein
VRVYDISFFCAGKAKKIDDLPMWLQYYPKTLFDTINRSGSGESKKNLILYRKATFVKNLSRYRSVEKNCCINNLHYGKIGTQHGGGRNRVI